MGGVGAGVMCWAEGVLGGGRERGGGGGQGRGRTAKQRAHRSGPPGGELGDGDDLLALCRLVLRRGAAGMGSGRGGAARGGVSVCSCGDCGGCGTGCKRRARCGASESSHRASDSAARAVGGAWARGNLRTVRGTARSGGASSRGRDRRGRLASRTLDGAAERPLRDDAGGNERVSRSAWAPERMNLL